MLLGMLCRICRCFTSGPREQEHAAKPEEKAGGEPPPEGAGKPRASASARVPRKGHQGVIDDLTAIRGIGIATQDRLNRAGIISYTQLAKAKPEEIRKILGNRTRAARAEEWIRQARELTTRE